MGAQLPRRSEPERNLYRVRGLTWERAGEIHSDPAFDDGHIDRHVYSQPLFW
jgi:hypothetical protein